MQQSRTIAALFIALAGRSPDTPLGPPSAGAVQEPVAAEAIGRRSAPESRPDVVYAANEIESGDAALGAALRAVRYPDFMLGIDYMNQPPG